MEITYSNRFVKAVSKASRMSSIQAAVFVTVLCASQAAMASTSVDVSGLCIIPQILKTVCAIVAVAAVMLWAIAHFSSKNDMADLTVKIGVPTVLASVAVTIITDLGLSSSCSL
ncbi:MULTISPECIES: hypothetical protein [unclassified Paraburkholderia]|uniref:hypothetical protein n=1 Tax=unclassified Paraburkholderia TaxID=2615204 RepID=UPI002AB12C52|nr:MULTISPECIES: hypothetical protein [unclassified Paraburkholderia]